jgi:RNA-directed DNA polymerase
LSPSRRAPAFLGFTVRRYRGKLLIKPSKAAVRRIRERLRTEMRSLRGASAQAVIARLSPVVRGWPACYRTVVSSQTFTALDHYLWKLTCKWARHSHPNKPARWIIRRYFGTSSKSRQDRWVFGDRDSGAYLHRFAWTKIVRHPMVRGTSSPDDPALAGYWAARRRRGIPRPIDAATLRLLQSQHGRCPCCGQLLLDADRPPQTPREWEQWLAAIRKAITKNAIATPAGSKPDEGRLRLLHAHCYRHYAGKREAQQLQPATSPRGFPEPRRGETRMSGSQGGRAQQCARPTRPTGALKRCLQQCADRLIWDDDPALSCGGCQVIPCGRERLAQGRSASRHRGDDGIEEFA